MKCVAGAKILRPKLYSNELYNYSNHGGGSARATAAAAG
jgi:hypothetical protein